LVQIVQICQGQTFDSSPPTQLWALGLPGLQDSDAVQDHTCTARAVVRSGHHTIARDDTDGSWETPHPSSVTDGMGGPTGRRAVRNRMTSWDFRGRFPGPGGW
jgi:hypothetical protein